MLFSYIMKNPYKLYIKITFTGVIKYMKDCFVLSTHTVLCVIPLLQSDFYFNKFGKIYIHSWWFLFNIQSLTCSCKINKI